MYIAFGFIIIVACVVLALAAPLVVKELTDRRKKYYVTVASKEDKTSMHCYKVKVKNMFYEGEKINCIVLYCKGYKFVIPKNQIVSVNVSVPITTDPRCRFLQGLRKLSFASLTVSYKVPW